MKKLIVIAALIIAAAFPAFAENKLPELSGGQVVLEWKDFKLILDEIMKGTVEIQSDVEPPSDYAIRAAVFSIDVRSGYATVKAGYGIETLLEKEWVAVPIGTDEVGVGEVFIDGRPALVSMESGEIRVLILGRGAHTIEASYTVAAPSSPGPNSFSVPVASVPGAIIGLTAPGELSDISIGSAVITAKDNASGRWSIKASGRALDRLSVSYSVPAPEAAIPEEEKKKQTPKVYSNVELLVTVADEVVSASAVFDLDVKHAPVSKFTVSLPAGYEVVNVSGQGLANWKAEAGKLNVLVGYEVQGGYQLNVDLEAKREMASGEVAIPELGADGVERESGFIAVVTSASLEVMAEKYEALLPVDAAEIPPSLRNRARYPVLWAFRFTRHPFTGLLKVTRYDEIAPLPAAIDSANLVVLMTDDGKSVTRVSFEVRNNKKQFIKINLPEGAEVWSAYVDNEPVKPAKNDKGQVLVPLKKSDSDIGKTSFDVELIYETPIPKMENKGVMNTTFPQTDIPASEMLVTLYLPEKYEFKKFEGDLKEIKERFEGTGRFTIYTTDGEQTEGEPLGMPEESRVPAKRKIMSRQAKMEKEIADEIQQQANAPAPAPAYQAATTRGVTGFLPVKFNVPLRGQVFRFEKLLVMDEAPKLTFKFKKLKDPFPWAKVWTGVKWGFLGFIVIGALWVVRKIFKKS